MTRSTTDTCCLTLPLKLEKWQEDRLEKRLEIARIVYNTFLNYELKKLRKLEASEEYIAIQNLLKETTEKSEKEKLYKQRDKLRQKAGFTEFSFIKGIKPFYKHFNDNIGSKVAQLDIAKRVWSAFEKMFKGNGKQVHFRKRGDYNSVQGYSDSKKSGGTEIMYRGSYIEWFGLKLPIKLDPDNVYENEMLQHWVKFCRIIRKPGRNKSHWYVQLMLEGKPTVKCNPKTGEIRYPVGTGNVGIDIGTQTIAYSSESEVVLQELADKVNNIEHEKRILQRKMDRSRRATNPDNYTEDGTIKRGVKLTHNKSRRYRKLQHNLAFLQHQQAEIRKQQHNDLVNHLLSRGNRFITEDMNWSTLTHRAKKTEISEKTGKHKRKKRFGKSVGNKAPAMLINLLDSKLKSRGLEGVIKVPTKLRASQYNHITDTYEKKKLSQRWNTMPDGRLIQRDMYSAFLLQYTKKDGDEYVFDKEALSRHYEKFVMFHDNCVEQLKSASKTLASMGIVRRAS